MMCFLYLERACLSWQIYFKIDVNMPKLNLKKASQIVAVVAVSSTTIYHYSRTDYKHWKLRWMKRKKPSLDAK